MKGMTSFLMLSWKRQNELQRCLWDLRNYLTGNELLILDNGSEAQQVNWLERFRDNHPQVTLFLSAVNRGVAGGRQFLLEQAKGDTLVILDSDVVIQRNDWLAKLKAPLANASVGLCGPAGHMISPDWRQFIPLPANQPQECDVVSGYCQAFRRQLLDEGVALDQAYNPYWTEDSDMCLQIRERGKLIWHTGDIGLRHEFAGSGDDGKFAEKTAYMAEKFRGKGLIFAERETKI